VATEYTWFPPKELVEQSNVKKLMDAYGFKDYRELVAKTAEDIEWWWATLAKEINVEWFRPYDRVYDSSQGIPWTKWFVGGKLNIAHNCLDRHAHSHIRHKIAFYWSGEDGRVEKYTYREVYVEANRLANALRGMGVGAGDVVSVCLPMLPQTVVSMYAALKLGAIFQPIFSGFGPSAIAARIRDAEPRVLITADATYRRGRVIKLKETVDEAAREAGFDQKVVTVKRVGVGVPWTDGRDYWWHEICENQPREFQTEQVDSEHPALLLHTSGTTGRPKGAVISHIGALLQSSKEIYFNLDLKPQDVFMWITDIGWMMGPWQIIGVQHHGGTHAIFEGAVDYPNPSRIWSMIQKFEVSILGGSATVFRMLKSYGRKWIEPYDISSLRITGNTGEPIDPDTWRWLLEQIGGGRCPVINLSGGTELLGCFLLPSPVIPLRPSTLGLPGLGMDIDVFDDEGRPIRGRIGYLVAKKPSPSMTRGFWKDPDRYLDTYWARWPGVWFHGDWASVDEDGYWYLHGRADDVIKIAGKRLGPAEVESIVNQHPAVRESAALGKPDEKKGEVLVCFVTLKPGHVPSEQLETEIGSLITRALGKPFAPEAIMFVSDLPRNRAGKLMRRTIRALLLGSQAEDTSVVDNPDAVEEIRRLVAAS